MSVFELLKTVPETIGEKYSGYYRYYRIEGLTGYKILKEIPFFIHGSIQIFSLRSEFHTLHAESIDNSHIGSGLSQELTLISAKDLLFYDPEYDGDACFDGIINVRKKAYRVMEKVNVKNSVYQYGLRSIRSMPEMKSDSHESKLN